MRYDTTIEFYQKQDEHYDPDLGAMVGGLSLVGSTMASVTDMGTKQSVVAFGDIRQGAKVIRLLPLFDVPQWDMLRIDKTSYEMTTTREPLNRHTLIVQEVAYGN